MSFELETKLSAASGQQVGHRAVSDSRLLVVMIKVNLFMHIKLDLRTPLRTLFQFNFSVLNGDLKFEYIMDLSIFVCDRRGWWHSKSVEWQPDGAPIGAHINNELRETNTES